MALHDVRDRSRHDARRARRAVVRLSLLLLVGAAWGGCARTYDLVIDNRTVRSLTLRVFSATEDGEFSQFPDRIFSLPPNREFRLNNAIVKRGHRRLFEFRGPDEQLVDSFVMTYEEIEASGGRITVPRGLTAIPRGTPPPAGFVDSTRYERIDFIPLFPEDAPRDSVRPSDPAPGAAPGER